MKIQILAEDVAKAGPYSDNYECLLCQVLKRLGYTGVKAGSYTVITNFGQFSLNGERWQKLAYGNNGSKARIEAIGTEFELCKL